MDPSFGNSTVVGAARESVCRQNLPSKLEMLLQMRRDHEVRSYLCAKQCLTLTRIHACTGIAGYFRVRWRPVRASILRSSKRAQVLALSKVHLPTSMHSAVTEWFAPSWVAHYGTTATDTLRYDYATLRSSGQLRWPLRPDSHAMHSACAMHSPETWHILCKCALGIPMRYPCTFPPFASTWNPCFTLCMPVSTLLRPRKRSSP